MFLIAWQQELVVGLITLARPNKNMDVDWLALHGLLLSDFLLIHPSRVITDENIFRGYIVVFAVD